VGVAVKTTNIDVIYDFGIYGGKVYEEIQEYAGLWTIKMI